MGGVRSPGEETFFDEVSSVNAIHPGIFELSQLPFLLVILPNFEAFFHY